MIETSGSTGPPKRVLLSRRAVLASAPATHAGSGGPGRWVLRAAGVVRRGRAGASSGRCWPATSRAGARRPRPRGRRRPDVATSRWCRPSCTGCSTTRADVAALRRFDAVLLGGGPIDPRCGPGPEERGIRVVATYGSSETAGGCVYDGVPARRRRGRARHGRPDPDRRPGALRRVRRRPGADRRRPWWTAGS